MIRPHTLLLPAALLTAGCTSGNGFLDVSFDRLDVKDISFDGADADFVFKVDNNTSFGLSVAEFDYALAFGGVEWLAGDDPDGLDLIADDYSEIALPTAIIFEDLYDMVQATRGEDNIGFGLDGNFGLALDTDTVSYDDSAGGEDTTGASSQGIEQGEDGTYILDIPYAADGDFPALRRPKFSYQKIRLADISLTNATVELDLGVDNEHGSNLWFTNFDYSLGLDGTTIASGLVADLGEVAGASSSDEAGAASIGTLTLPIELDLLSLGSAGVDIYNALVNKEPLNLDLAAATDVDTPFGLVTLAIDESGAVSIE